MSTVLSPEPRADAALPAIGLLVLARVATPGGATHGDLVRDLAPYVAHKLAPAAWREAVARSIAGLAAQGLAGIARNRVELTDAGWQAAYDALGKPLPRTWGEMRDVRLVARALGLVGESALRIRRLAKPDGLRAAILQQAYGLKIKGAPSAARLRQALAVVALERAFGNTLKGSLGSRTGLSAKAGRLLAAQLSRRPRDLGTDGRLVAALAAEQVGTFQTGADALRTAILRSFVAQQLASGPPPASTAVSRHTADDGAARTPVRPGPARPRPAAASRPDIGGFADAVRSAASARAEGWPGNRKAFISHVWQAVQAQYPQWGLTDIEFKAMLAEAHRTGHVALANADLKDKRNLKDLQDSAVAYKNTVWHFVRVDS